MAIFRSTIFDNVRKKLANTVMYKRDSMGIMRSNPGKIKNPRTSVQLIQRAKMKFLVDLSRRFTPIIRVGFCKRPSGMTVYNGFIKANMVLVTVDESYAASIELDKIICSNGIIDEPDVTATFADGAITVTQTEQPSCGTGTADDMIYAGFYESSVKSARLVEIGERGTTGSAEFILPKKWTKENLHVYAFAVSHSKKHTSPTLYVELP